MKSTLSPKRKAYAIALRSVIYLCVAVMVALLVAIIGYVFVRGIPSITWDFLTTERSVLQGTIGILPNIIFTLYVIFTTLIIAVPIGIGAAIYLQEYATSKRFVRVIEFCAETLTGIPSIIFGLVGMLLFCQRLGLQSSILAGSLTLTVMILPTIIRTTQEALKTVPVAYREGAMGLGATKWYMIRTIILPSSLDGIVGGAILAIGRVVGESAALLFTAGMGYALITNYFEALGASGGTLSVMLYVYASEEGKFDVAFAIASILMLIVLVINFATKFVKKKLKK